MDLPTAQWLSQQRWFAGRTRRVASVTSAGHADLPGGWRHSLITVAYADGSTERYQLVLDPDGRDALTDPAVGQRLVGLIAAGETISGLRFSTEPGAVIDPAAPARVVTAEQSNTSIVLGTAAILKMFRRVVPGLNPDLELSRTLRDRGNPHVPPVLGAIESADPDGTPLTLGMLTTFAAGARDGWAVAVEHAAAGSDFANQAALLGEATAIVHADLAAGLGAVTGRPPIAHLSTRLHQAMAQVPELGGYLDRAETVLHAADRPTTLHRIHGDLHLGQVLQTDAGWLLIDFEGEPGAPIDERRRPDSPLRDVAGMLRSFDYASYQSVADRPDDRDAVALAQDWAGVQRAAFCAGYASVAGVDPRAHRAGLAAYELDKLAYEVVYEARYRPSWQWIPLRALAALLS